MNSKKELPKSYTPESVEQEKIIFWEENRFFIADPKTLKKTFSIVMPPPNVTGILHMGHALVNTLQDIIVRWKRMMGFEVLWVPGTDHAGIATQTVVERHLMKTEGKKRSNYSREEFLKKVFLFKEENQKFIIGQIKRLGCSCDWSRFAFTMDEQRNRSVRVMFKKLFDKGLIYRGDYLVNWDPVAQTAIADDEVEHEERASHLWHFRYPIKNSDEFITIATTRPETMLGDTAVAVSPKDPRYQHLIGKVVKLPLSGREIPIIADNFVDPEFGTGAVKVTPAHDHNDYQMGLTHKLPMIDMMTLDGRINENGGAFQGLTMAEGREAVVEAMKKLGFLVKIEPHTLRVGISYRSKAVIEPKLSKQWFVKLASFSPYLREIVEKEGVKLNPKNWNTTYFHWIDHLRDWCISRQLWWGHQIPIWYNKENENEMVCFDGEGEPDCVKQNPDRWVRDNDVLDTWFSSALWPFSTLGWPDDTEELKRFYPNSLLVTGHDILFFWVARMIMMGHSCLDKPPFPETFLHGLIFAKSYWRENPNGGITYVLDEERKRFDLGEPLPKGVHSKWEKMSKSKGNVLDPVEIAKQYGTDALRMALISSSPQSREIDLDRRRFEEFKNFTNKVWNGARFVFMNLKSEESPLTREEFGEGINESQLLIEDRWILSKLVKTVKEVNEALQNYQFDIASSKSYDFFWKEFCAYYVEISKPYLFGKAGTQENRKTKQKLLAIVLCQSLRLLHPMAPFITEELFQYLKEDLESSLIPSDPYTKDALEALQAKALAVSTYPRVLNERDLNPEIEALFETIETLVWAIRNVRGEMKLPPSLATDVYIIGPKQELELVEKSQEAIKALVKLKHLYFTQEEPKLSLSSQTSVKGFKVILPLPEELKEKELERIEKEKEKLIQSIEKLKNQLSNETFTSKAPKQLVEAQRTQLREQEEALKSYHNL